MGVGGPPAATTVCVVTPQPDKMRRAPKFTAFLVTGGIVGVLVGFLLSVTGNPDTGYDASTALGFLGLICAALGVLLGGIVAVLLDRRS